MRALLQQICDLVQREELVACLNALELLDANSDAVPTPTAPPPAAPQAESVGADSLPTYVFI